METKPITSKQADEYIVHKLSHYFGVSPMEATNEQFYQATAMMLRDLLQQQRKEFETAAAKTPGCKKVYYLCMEFLMGRSLKNNLYNLGCTKAVESALARHGIKLDTLYECEPDAGLGNGGLGRLAACYLDALAHGGYPATGYSILYEYGFFRQKLVDGWQTELPDFWLPGGEVWLVPHEEKSVEVRFEGRIEESWDGAFHHVEHKDYTPITAVPHDMYVSGKGGKGVSVLRLWAAKSPGLDMNLFNQGDYMRAMERNAMAEVISKVLYPDDNHPEGKSLRLRQQYFLVSASMQDIVQRHLHHNDTMDNFADKTAIHINDTHPTLAIPELMRILLDECGYSWDDAWRIVTNTMAYTNHTVMREALECWPEDLFKRLLPRIYQITREIDNRLRSFVWGATHDAGVVENTAIISAGVIRMANLCVAASHHVNGVSALHSEILKKTVFSDFYRLTPMKFTNVTNGIASRRWLCQANPRLTALITELIGGGFVDDLDQLRNLKKFTDDPAVLQRVGEIKLANKQDLAELIYKNTKIEVDPSSIFDLQVKRLHEYKRQNMNALRILMRYRAIKADPDAGWIPHTYIFGAKAASGYFMAKKIISFICAIADLVNQDPVVSKYMKVVYMEDYNVTMAERLMPAADLSEQISLAGTEASGTSNMKLMLNGAITLGTLDGANIEIREMVGDENIFIFGMTTPEVEQIKRNGYNPHQYYLNNWTVHDTIDAVNRGLLGKDFHEVIQGLSITDPYMVMADLDDYCRAHERVEQAWQDRNGWNRMSLMNTACAGPFSADRAIGEYARDIWHTRPVDFKSK